jgi:ferredoxin
MHLTLSQGASWFIICAYTGGHFYLGVSKNMGLPEPVPSRLLLVRFELSGTTVAISPGTSLLEAAKRAGIAMPSTCGGQCDCGECRITVIEGQVTPPTREELEELSEEELNSGLRLACCARITTSAKILA